MNIRTIRPENIIQMHEKMNTIYGKKSLQCMGIEPTIQLFNWTCALALLATEPATEVVPFFYSSGYAWYEKVEKFKLKYENFQVYAMLNYHPNIL